MDELFGLPAHPLVVHGAVVLLPLAAIAVLAVAIRPRWARSAFGYVTVALPLVSLVTVILAQRSGESLEERVQETALVERHAELGESVLPWAIVLLVVALLVVAFARFGSRLQVREAVARGVLVALAVVAGVGAIWKVVDVGHSGAKAAWSDVGPAESDD